MNGLINSQFHVKISYTLLSFEDLKTYGANVLIVETIQHTHKELICRIVPLLESAIVSLSLLAEPFV